jgi:hypothetical protein
MAKEAWALEQTVSASSGKGDGLQCAFHIAIPDVDNGSGAQKVSYRVALKEWLDGGDVTRIPDLGTRDATRLAALQNGEFYEIVSTVPYPQGGNTSKADKVLAIQAHFDANKQRWLDDLIEKLRFWRATRDYTQPTVSDP